ncbi:MAG: ECF transporter S component [Anaerolineales bacterium]|nr:ECF transporter S component [Anaerolineales bacterium]
MFDKIKSNFNTQTWVLIPIAIAINIAIGQIVGLLKLPVFLDSIGTVLVAALCGPWAGALTGTLSNLIWGVTMDPNALPWWPVAFMIGYMAGRMAEWGFFKSWWKIVVTGFVIAITAAIVSTPISVYLYGGITSSGSSFITAYLMQTGTDMVAAVFSTNFLVEPVDKIITAMLAFSIILGLPKRIVGGYPKSEQAQVEGGNTQQQLYIAVGVIVVLILLAIFVISKITGG